MTSVQNRPLLLSGSNTLALILALLLFAACDLFAPIQTTPPGGGGNGDDTEEEDLGEVRGGRVYNPETGEYEDAENILADEMLTIEWEEVPTSDYEPIGSDRTTPIDIDDPIDGVDGEENPDLRDNYNVALMLPFLTNRFSETDAEIDKNSKWAIQFYAGAKVAFDKLEEEGANLTVSVFDTEANPSTVSNLLQEPAVEDAHLIMGSVQKSCAQRIADHAKFNQVPFVSPYIASQSITKENPNPFYVQIRPTLPTHLEVLMKHVTDNHKKENIVLVRREDDYEAALMQYMQQLHEDIVGSEYTSPLSEAIISDETASLENFEIETILKSSRNTVFVVTSAEDKTFVNSFLQKAFNATREQNHRITVYGMPQWADFRGMDYEYYEKLNLHISSEQYVDSYAADVREFKKAYFDKYGESPSVEAFRGYDDMLYFGRMLQKHGLGLLNHLGEEQAEMFHTRFQLNPVTKITTSPFGEEEYGPIERFENQFVYILEFNNYHFQPAK